MRQVVRAWSQFQLPPLSRPIAGHILRALSVLGGRALAYPMGNPRLLTRTNWFVCQGLDKIVEVFKGMFP